MKFLLAVLFIVAITCLNARVARGAALLDSESKQAQQKQLKGINGAKIDNGVNALDAVENLRYRKAAYGGGSSSGGYGGGASSSSSASIPAPPCPKNYLFSCQPSLSPVPCAASSSGGGGGGYQSAGAYSAPVPVYAYPLAPAPFAVLKEN